MIVYPFALRTWTHTPSSEWMYASEERRSPRGFCIHTEVTYLYALLLSHCDSLCLWWIRISTVAKIGECILFLFYYFATCLYAHHRSMTCCVHIRRLIPWLQWKWRKKGKKESPREIRLSVHNTYYSREIRTRSASNTEQNQTRSFSVSRCLVYLFFLLTRFSLFFVIVFCMKYSQVWQHEYVTLAKNSSVCTVETPVVRTRTFGFNLNQDSSHTAVGFLWWTNTTDKTYSKRRKFRSVAWSPKQSTRNTSRYS